MSKACNSVLYVRKHNKVYIEFRHPNLCIVYKYIYCQIIKVWMAKIEKKTWHPGN